MKMPGGGGARATGKSREVFVLDGYIRSMRFAVSLFVIAVGAILAFGVADSPDDSVRVHLIGLILIVTGLVGLVMACQLFVSRRRTDIIYREDGAPDGACAGPAGCPRSAPPPG